MPTETYFVPSSEVPEEMEEIERLLIQIEEFPVVMGVLAHFVAIGITMQIQEDGETLEGALKIFNDVVRKNMTVVDLKRKSDA